MQGRGVLGRGLAGSCLCWLGRVRRQRGLSGRSAASLRLEDFHPLPQFNCLLLEIFYLLYEKPDRLLIGWGRVLGQDLAAKYHERNRCPKQSSHSFASAVCL